MPIIRALSIGFLAFISSVLLGILELPMPYPAHNKTTKDINPEYFKYTKASLINKTPYETNTALQSTRKLFEGEIEGCETVLPTKDGSGIFMGDKHGKILYAKAEENNINFKLDKTSFADLGPERVLGLAFDLENNIIVCSAIKGLYHIDKNSKEVKLLTNHVSPDSKIDPNTKITYANDVIVSKKTGIIYFTDTTDIPVVYDEKNKFYNTYNTFMLNILEGNPTGRLLKYDPNQNKTEVVIKHLWGPNGLTLSQDESFIAIVETNLLRVIKYWLTGPKSGKIDVLISNLPGFPDGMSIAPNGDFWIAILSKTPFYYNFIMKYKGMRLGAAWIKNYLGAISMRPWGFTLRINENGDVLYCLMDIDGAFVSYVSAVYELDNWLYIGNLAGDYISIFDLNMIQKFKEFDDDSNTLHYEL